MGKKKENKTINENGNNIKPIIRDEIDHAFNQYCQNDWNYMAEKIKLDIIPEIRDTHFFHSIHGHSLNGHSNFHDWVTGNDNK